jgi:hypothetical protein
MVPHCLQGKILIPSNLYSYLNLPFQSHLPLNLANILLDASMFLSLSLLLAYLNPNLAS